MVIAVVLAAAFIVAAAYIFVTNSDVFNLNEIYLIVLAAVGFIAAGALWDTSPSPTQPTPSPTP